MLRSVTLMLVLVIVLTTLPEGAPLTFAPKTAAAQTAPAPLSAVWLSGENSDARTAAWGDVDGDGDLDLAVGEATNNAGRGGEVRLYRNCARSLPGDGCAESGTTVGLTPNPVWLSLSQDRPFWSTLSLAWGDVDNDGDLDLVAAGSPNRLYRNCTLRQSGDGCVVNGVTTTDGLARQEVLLINNLGPAGAVAWGDADGDGDLDLAIGGASARLFLNCTIAANALSTPDDDCAAGEPVIRNTPAWISSDTENAGISSLAWGDVDGDGDLDLAVGNNGSGVRLYRNCTVQEPDYSCANREVNGGFTVSSIWWSNDTPAGSSGLAWGDVDGDGDLDLAASSGSAGARLYRNDNGALTTTITWSPAAGVNGSSLAWGDADGDGDLDLALGVDGAPSRLFRNCTRSQAADGCATSGTDSGLMDNAIWLAPVTERTSAVAWGDVDADGDLDLFAANAAINGVDQPARLYRNDTSPLLSAGTPFQDTWRTDLSYSVAWGDVDGDGDLDLANSHAGTASNNSLTRVEVYASLGAIGVTGGLRWNSGVTSVTTSAAWGDMDGDGDLDLAVGRGFGADPRETGVYRNCTFRQDGDGCGAGLSTDFIWYSRLKEQTRSVAWGDVDGDGDLDLAVGNVRSPQRGGGQNRIYRNCTISQLADGCAASGPGAGLASTPVWSSAETDDSWSVAWGDVDGDGDLDLAVGNNGQPNRLYRNDGGILSASAVWSSNESDGTYSVAWGDVDGDGDLDLAMGNFGQQNRLYRNENFTLTRSAAWSSSEIASATGVTWGDVDGDGDLDLAVANGFATPPANLLYRNDSGTLTATAAWVSEPGEGAFGLAWGDADSDGDLDLAAANRGRPNTIFTSRRQGSALGPPSVTLRQPRGDQPAHGAGGYAVANYVGAPTLSFTYTLRHPHSQPAGSLRAQYSLDGASWRDAVPALITDTGRLRSSPDGVEHTYTWDLAASDVFGQSDQALLRLVIGAGDPEITPSEGRAVPANGLATRGLPGPFLYVTSSATTTPFRLRGMVARVVDQSNNPVSGALVYRLPAGAVRGALPLRETSTSGASNTLSNAGGYVPSRTPMYLGDRLIGVKEITHSQKLTLYHTSGIDKAVGIPAYQVAQYGTQTLTVSPNNPLLALNLTVSLEWDATNDLAFMTQLRRDLARTAELLYDWTDGQVTIGSVTIYHDRANWEQSDVQIFATNRLRPNATQGGIGGDRNDPTAPGVTYTAGQVRIPATWSRNAIPGEIFGEDWPRTLAHELGHYALYLDDNYLGLDRATGNLITVAGCPGAMSNPYSDLESEFQPDGPAWQPGGSCAQTLSADSTGRSDWATIATFYPQLKKPGSYNEFPGPSRLTINLLTINEVGDPGASQEALLNLTVAGNGSVRVYEPSVVARAVLFKARSSRAIDLGAPTGDLLLVRGASAGDSVCVYDTLQELVGCTTVSPLATGLELRRQPEWQPSVQITPITSTTLRLEATLPMTVTAPPASLMAQIFPEAGDPVTITLSPTQTSLGLTYAVTWTLTTPALGALVRLWDPVAPLEREAVADYNLGGDPAPPRKPLKRKRRAPALSSDGQALLLTDNLNFQPGEFYAFQTVDRLPPPPPYATPVGLGYRLLASDATLRSQIALSTTLALSYFSSDVPQGAERGVAMYYYPPGGSAWQLVPLSKDVGENTVGARPLGEGLYALMTSVPLRLKGGWNLVFAYPGDTQPLPDALSNVGGSYNLIYGYDEDDEDDPWKVHAPELSLPVPVQPWADLVNDLKVVENGGSYWIRGTREVTLSVRPSLGSTLALAQAGSILGAPPATYYGVAPATIVVSLTVRALVGPDENVCGTAATQPVTVDGVSVLGFSLNVLANGTGDAEGCGSPGAAVRLAFFDGVQEVGSFRATWDNTRLNAVNLPRGSIKIYLPTIAQTKALQPDLQVVGVTVVPAPPGSGENYELLVTIRNAGPLAVERPFWVDLYVDPEGRPSRGVGWPDAANFGASWRVYNLGAGATLTLSSLEPNDPLDPGRNYTELPAFLQAETYTLYVQVDVFESGGNPDGVIVEGDEANNIGGPFVITPGEP